MRQTVIAIVLFAGLAMPAAAATRGFPVGGFDRVRTTGPFDVRVHVGGAPAVRADGPQEVLDRLRIEVRGGELVIGTTPGSWMSGWHWGWGKQGRTVISVVAPALVGASLSGPGNLDVDRTRARSFEASLSGPGNLTIGALEAGDATFTLSGPGDLTVSGRAARARMTLSGPGDIRAQGFTARDLTVMLSGPGDITTNAIRSADGRLSGPGDVTIGGHPRCTISKSGPGDVRCG